MKTAINVASYGRELELQRAISIQSRAISLLWGLEHSFLSNEQKNKDFESAYKNELFDRQLKNETMSSIHSIESENHLSLHSNHLEIDEYLEITDFVRSKALKQEKVQSISQNNSQVSLSMMAASLLQ